ncbi:uncharacterized protein ACLA_058960 [Aspergillus clavatus NRRL 1]|uniref:Uncharacterized protein n=1 Tax=Aspergillus clavatus (strain ATCC 1007 / CBS 513.65 / DSM 816 / NCTC 3887 / NRRL 1 / QM 1276 / 107) TaxID=344612 RepID=A1C494_ASPCL|nr:uncharacterized protein ACLA_058960 [Aspergillus clavatus NRRL 1]EAW15234.1 conserved hypothetical protein [Aspergillus clavatus NRRL 1]
MSDSSEKRGTGEKPPSNPSKQANSRKDTTENQSSPSLASRIQSSASGLARSAFSATGPSANAAQVLGGGSKAGPSSPATAALAAVDQHRDTTAPASSTRGQSAHLPADSFRSASTGQHGAFELPPLTEDEFQRTYDEPHLRSDIDFSASAIGIDSQEVKGKGKGKASDSTSTSTNEPSSTSAHADSEHHTHTWQSSLPTTATTLPTDGAAVISLLSSPSFNPDFPQTADEPFEPVETDPLPPQLTSSEIEMLDSFRRSATVDPSTPAHQPHRLTSLSLVPDIDSILDSVPASIATDVTALRDAVLTNLPGAADWIAVEERYHDEVWGYLRPTLEAAAEEIEVAKEQGRDALVEDGPAVRRLKMILGHMQR